MPQSPLIIVNNQPQLAISALDRGLAYGDGVFETMSVNNGDISLWQYHYQRLALGLRRLHIDLKVDRLRIHLQSTMTAVDAQYRGVNGTLKLLITRGDSVGGYAPPEDSVLTLISFFSPWADDFIDNNQLHQHQGVEVHCCEAYLPINATLAGIKSLNQLPYVLASRERQYLTAKEGLLFTQSGHVVEATARNIFIVKNKQMFTPALNECGVAGVMRRLIMDDIARISGVKVNELALSKKNLFLADEIFLTNSVSHIWPVVQCDNSRWPVGEVTKTIQRNAEQFIKSSDSLGLSNFLSSDFKQ
jgi:4-amino-4-deoxychorismate lyase